MAPSPAISAVEKICGMSAGFRTFAERPTYRRLAPLKYEQREIVAASRDFRRRLIKSYWDLNRLFGLVGVFCGDVTFVRYLRGFLNYFFH